MRDCEVITVDKDKYGLLKGISSAATIGFYMVSSVAAGVFLGRLADRSFGSQPWGTVIGVILGMVTGMWSIYKKVVGGK